MKFNKLILFLVVASMVSAGCAKRRAAPVPKVEETASTTDGSLEFLDSFEEDDLFAMEPALTENSDDSTMGAYSEPMIQSSAAPVTSNGSYTVVKGDTLMYVAYKLYGDYRKWPSLARMNNLNGSSALQAGTVLTIDQSQVRSLPRKEGTPYLIKSGDTLSKISMANYGTFDQWRPLWQHNSEMIKDPNIIFAGFQMYLLPDGQLAFNR